MMKSFQLVLSTLSISILAACGGGSDDNDQNIKNSNTAQLSAGCAEAIPSQDLIAITVGGDIGRAKFKTNETILTIEYTPSGISGENWFHNRTLEIQSIDGSCHFMATGTEAKGQTVSLASNRLGVASHPVWMTPVLLLGDIRTDIADAAGTYSMVRYQIDQPRDNTAPAYRSSYATFVIDDKGGWSFYKNGDINSALTATGNIEKDQDSGRMLLVTGSGADRVVRGKVFVSGTGDSKLLAFAENDPGDAEGSVTGLWVAAPQVPYSSFSGQIDGKYMTYNNDPLPEQKPITVKGTTFTVDGKKTITAIADQPITGLLTATLDQPNYALVRSNLFAVISNENYPDNSGGYLEIGVIPKK